MKRGRRGGFWAGAVFGALLVCGGAVPGWSGEADLADAAEARNWGRVEALLQEGADVNAGQADGTTVLHWAVQQDEEGAVRALLGAGADAGASNRYGVQPLSLACVNGNEAIVRALIEAGADPNAALRGGETALMTAARTGRRGPLKALLESGAEVDAADRKGQTAVFWAAADGHAEAVEELIGAGADFRSPLRSGFTPLLFAAREGRTEVVRILLRHGADVDEAIRRRGPAGPRAPRNGMNALMFAVENGHFELALELVDSGADPNDLRSGFGALHALTWVRRPNRGDDEAGQPSPRGSGVVNSLDFVRELVRRGADVNARLEKGDGGPGKLRLKGATPFLLAAKTADLPLMKLLVELGADPLMANASGSTPLMAAAGLGCLAPDEEAGTEDECVAAVEYLLSLGAALDTVDENDETAMHGAAYKSLPKVVSLLAARGLGVEVWNRQNAYEWTPLLIAEGFRPGNFKPSVETIAAIHEAMRASGIEPPPPTPRPDPVRETYQERE